VANRGPWGRLYWWLPIGSYVFKRCSYWLLQSFRKEKEKSTKISDFWWSKTPSKRKVRKSPFCFYCFKRKVAWDLGIAVREEGLLIFQASFQKIQWAVHRSFRKATERPKSLTRPCCYDPILNQRFFVKERERWIGIWELAVNWKSDHCQRVVLYNLSVFLTSVCRTKPVHTSQIGNQPPARLKTQNPCFFRRYF
jgi:hypothetical protein